MIIPGITGIILAGGKSSRFGYDKATAPYKGKSLLKNVSNYLKPYCTEIIISSDNKSHAIRGYQVVPDIIKNKGPLGGIQSCMKAAKHPFCLITACDIPEINEEILHSMVYADSEVDMVFLTLRNDLIQPLPLLLHQKTLPYVDRQILGGNFKLQVFIREIMADSSLSYLKINIDRRPLNINTQTDLCS